MNRIFTWCLVFAVWCLPLAGFGQAYPNPPVFATPAGKALIAKTTTAAMRSYLGVGSGGGLVSNYYGATWSFATRYTNATAYAAKVQFQFALTGGAPTTSGFNLSIDYDASGSDDFIRYYGESGVATSYDTADFIVPPNGVWHAEDASTGGGSASITSGRGGINYFTTNSTASSGGLDASTTNWVTATATNAAKTVRGSAVNIKLAPYNATGDGSTDDSLAFYYARTNPVIFIPAGTYITTNVFFSNSVAISGEAGSSIIKFKSNIYGAGDQFSGNYVFHSRYGSLKLRDLIFDGQTSTNWYLTQGSYTNRNPISAGSGLYRGGVFLGTDTNTTPIVDSCEFRNFDGAGVYIRGAENAQNAVSGRAIVINSTFTNNYSGVLTDSGGTADYTRIEGNVFHRNYHALELRGANVTVIGNQATSNYITLWISTSDGRSHNTIVGNTFNHSGLAAFYMEGAKTGAGISANSFAGGADIYFLYGGGSGTSNQVFRANRFDSCNIYSAAGCASNSFLLNDFASGAPSWSGSGLVWFWHNITPTNSIWPDDYPRVITNYFPWKQVQWGNTVPTVLNPDSSGVPTTSEYGYSGSANLSTHYCVIPVNRDATNVLITYNVETAHTGAAGAYWTDNWRVCYISPIGGRVYTSSNGVPVQVYNVAGNLQTSISVNFAFPVTNAFKYLWFYPQASTNTQARYWVNDIKLVQTIP